MRLRTWWLPLLLAAGATCVTVWVVVARALQPLVLARVATGIVAGAGATMAAVTVYDELRRNDLLAAVYMLWLTGMIFLLPSGLPFALLLGSPGHDRCVAAALAGLLPLAMAVCAMGFLPILFGWDSTEEGRVRTLVVIETPVIALAVTAAAGVYAAWKARAGVP